MTDSNPKSTCPTCGQPWDEVERLRKSCGWVSVQERLPQEGEPVLVWNTDGCRRAKLSSAYGDKPPAWYECSDTCGCCDRFDGKSVTHWMPLPAPPQFDEADHENPEKDPDKEQP